jgi:ribosome recycling factor
MAYNFTPFKDKTKNIEDWLKREFSSIRTGQASPSILDGISVESYGTKMSLNQIANITIEDARTLKISPWDTTQIKDIEKAIIVSNLGLSARIDDTGLHISFPQLTADRRTSLVKISKEKAEEAKISLRKERERVLKDIDAKEEEGSVSEDEKKRLKNELQKLVDEMNKKFDEIKERKEKEIMS